METEHTLVLIKWLDITAVADWTPADEVNPLEVQTLGWIAFEDSNVIKVGNSLGEDGEIYGISALPQGCVVSTTILSVSPVSTHGPVVVQPEPSEHLPSTSSTVLPLAWHRSSSKTEARPSQD